MIKSDQGNPQTPALIQTYNLSLIFCVKDIVCETFGCNSGRKQALQYIYKVQCIPLSESADG
eukprot:jgi/Botrbrau1/4913/Bobra.118_1s0026.1